MKEHFEKSQEVPINQSNSIMKNLLQRLTESVYENQHLTIEFEKKLNEIKLLDELEEKSDNGPGICQGPSDLLEEYESTIKLLERTNERIRKNLEHLYMIA